MGEPEKAFLAADYGRSLDTADRYLSNVTIEYALKNDDLGTADYHMQAFIKEDNHLASVHRL